MKNFSYLDEINSRNEKSPHYFAAANTHDGFVSFFSDIFDKESTNRIYILKGGPGSGKSTLMKRYAENALKNGQNPIYYHCSSDPYSLDGVVVPETGTVILDGTAPHVFEPVYPGSRDVYVDLGKAWNTEKLSSLSKEIEKLCRMKSKCYKTAYQLLSAAKRIDSEMQSLAFSFINTEKVHTCAKRFGAKYLKKSICTNDKNKVTKVLTDGISSMGKVRFFTLEKQSETLFFIKKQKLAERFFMEELAQMVKLSGAEAVFAMSPENPALTNAIYLPDAKICISMYSESYQAELEKQGIPFKTVNPAKFIDTEKYKSCRSAFRFCEKCLDTLTETACSELSRAGVFHDELEKIYGEATDYSVVSRIGKSLLK